MKLPKHPILQTAFLAALALPASAVVNIDYVSVGNAGNAADPATGSIYGAVAYAYQIGKNETTISQYAEFLNVAAKTDSYGLYNGNMSTDLNIAGITRSGTSGSYSYSVVSGSGNKPITYVSWFDAARFCNWLQNGQGSGSTETGAYTLSEATSGIFTKNVGATVWIPSESEWYKAAYYDPNKGGPGIGGYWAQATQSNTITSNTVGVAGAANYNTSSLNATGAYGTNSDSYYETNDQAGNVYEWNDAVIFGSNRGSRGGAWANNLASSLRSSERNSYNPTNEYSSVGFRVASVPEPTSLVLALLTSVAILTRRSRRA